MDYILSYTDLPKLHIAVAVFVGMFAIIIHLGRKREKIIFGILMTWLILVLSCTVLSRPPFEGNHIKFIPLWINGVHKSDILNIFLLMPFGILLPIIGKRGMHIALIGLFCTISIETLQYITNTGFFDVNDIVMNELGVIIGYILWSIIRQLILSKRDSPGQL